MLIVPLLVTLVLTLFQTAVAQAERWRQPLGESRVAREFDFDARAPFAGGSIRGTRLAAAPGALVRAPCGGSVTFAGRHPRLGHGVSLRCGRLIATELGLESTLVDKGSAVPAGHPVGRLGASGMLHLGARRASRRLGYLDPMKLIARPGRPPPVAPAPRSSPPREPTRPGPHVATKPDPSRHAPPLAWLGTALAGIGAGLGTALGRRTARARATPVKGRWRAGEQGVGPAAPRRP